MLVIVTCREIEPSGDTKTKITPLMEKNNDKFLVYLDWHSQHRSGDQRIPAGAVKLLKNSQG
jgi:hypothetical protein